MQNIPDLGGDLEKSLGLSRLRCRGDDGLACITRTPDRGVQGNLTQERDLQPAGLLLAATMVEDLGSPGAVGTQKVAHVFHDPQHRDIDLPKHRHTLDRIGQRYVLRRPPPHKRKNSDETIYGSTVEYHLSVRTVELTADKGVQPGLVDGDGRLVGEDGQ